MKYITYWALISAQMFISKKYPKSKNNSKSVHISNNTNKYVKAIDTFFIGASIKLNISGIIHKLLHYIFLQSLILFISCCCYDTTFTEFMMFSSDSRNPLSYIYQ